MLVYTKIFKQNDCLEFQHFDFVWNTQRFGRTPANISFCVDPDKICLNLDKPFFQCNAQDVGVTLILPQMSTDIESTSKMRTVPLVFMLVVFRIEPVDWIGNLCLIR